jgi:hypothetical protein
MYNMRIAFHIHKLAYLNCAWLANSADVITPQVNEHDMLSTLLLIVLEFLFQSQVFSGILTPRASTSDGVIRYYAILNSHQKLGGSSYNIEIT